MVLCLASIFWQEEKLCTKCRTSLRMFVQIVSLGACCTSNASDFSTPQCKCGNLLSIHVALEYIVTRYDILWLESAAQPSRTSAGMSALPGTCSIVASYSWISSFLCNTFLEPWTLRWSVRIDQVIQAKKSPINDVCLFFYGWPTCQWSMKYDPQETNWFFDDTLFW